jgi:hypothetical protein
VISSDHTQAHTTVGRTPLDQGSARRRDLYPTTRTLYKTNIHATGGIRAHDPSKRSAADLRLRPRSHWDGLFFLRFIIFDVSCLWLVISYIFFMFLYRPCNLAFGCCVSTLLIIKNGIIIIVIKTKSGHETKAYVGVEVQLCSYVRSILDNFTPRPV